MITANLSLLLATVAVSVANGTELTGYLMDRLCIRRCDKQNNTESCNPDGSNAFYTPEDHTGWCLKIKLCEESGYMLMSEETDANGKHSIIANFTDAPSKTAVVSYIDTVSAGKRVAMPLVTVVYDDNAVSVTSDAGETIVQVTDAVIKDPWPADADVYTGADTTQTLCEDLSAADIDGNNMCFRSDVKVSKADTKGMFVIESNGCPDHANMKGGSGIIANSQADPVVGGGVVAGSGGGCDACTACDSGACGCGVCSAQAGQPCPSTLDNSIEIDDATTLHYALVPASPPGSGNGLLCGRLEADHAGWIGLGFSEEGKMAGSDAIIGVPGAKTVLKYDLDSYAAQPAMSDDKQTLKDTSIVTENGKTIMKFTKLLVEDGEIPISEAGVNFFLHARGSDSLGYHTARSSFQKDFAEDSASCSACSASTGCSAGCGSCASTSCASTSCASASCASTSCASTSCASTSCASTSCASQSRSVCTSDSTREGGCGAGCGAGCDAGCGDGKCGAGCGDGCGDGKCGAGCGDGKCGAGCGDGKCGAGCDAGKCGAGCDAGCGAGCACGGCACGSSSASKGTTTHGVHDPMYQHYTMMIPQDPGTPGVATKITDDVVGIMTNGVLLDSHSQTWSYDMCNGHSDTKRQYHYHIPPICYLKSMGVATPNAPNWWINDASNEVRAYAEMTDQFPQTASASPVVGFARDGFPIYALYDATGNIQRIADLDECNGKADSNGYGYYITAEPPFVPTCLKGNVGSIAYATTTIACPSEGITNVIAGVAIPVVVDSDGDSSAGYAKIPLLGTLVLVVAATMAFFI